jgi:riboflavin kinase/FMN adenylyltransferase
MLNGIVIHGDKRGRLIGFPTANLQLPPDKLLPANGIYATYVSIGEMSRQSDVVHCPCVLLHEKIPSENTFIAAVNIGVRPQFDGQKRLVEAYLLDVPWLDLYGRCLSIHVIARLRDEARFASVDALVAQMAEDVKQTRQLLQRDGMIE